MLLALQQLCSSIRCWGKALFGKPGPRLTRFQELCEIQKVGEEPALPWCSHWKHSEDNPSPPLACCLQAHTEDVAGGHQPAGTGPLLVRGWLGMDVGTPKGKGEGSMGLSHKRREIILGKPGAAAGAQRGAHRATSSCSTAGPPPPAPISMERCCQPIPCSFQPLFFFFLFPLRRRQSRKLTPRSRRGGFEQDNPFGQASNTSMRAICFSD